MNESRTANSDGVPLASHLPISENPSVRAFHFYAFPVAIVEACLPEQRDWILSNFVHLAYDEHATSSPPLCFYVFDAALNPHLSTVTAEVGWMREWIGRTLSEFAHEQVRKGWYIHTFLDEFFIPHRTHHHMTHFVHDVLIHGSDHRRKTVDLLGYDELVRFRSTRATWAELDAAHQSGVDIDEPWANKVILYKPNGNPAYTLDADLVAADVANFVMCANPSAAFHAFRRPLDLRYGLNAVRSYHRDLVRCRDRGDELDLHAPQLLFEHARLMLERVCRLLDSSREDAGEFESTFTEVVRFARHLKPAVLGANVLRDYSAVDRLLAEFPRIIEIQEEALVRALQRYGWPVARQ